jgi:hypothetical protein
MDSLKTLSYVALSGGPPGDLSLDFLAPTDYPGAGGQVGGYPVLAVVGRGGMGVVFTAVDRALNRVVAVKVLDPRRAGSGTDRQRFLREAWAAAAVSHPHVIGIHAVDEDRGLPYLVMEYVPGGSLQDRIDRDGPLGAAEAVRVALQTAEGLAAAHAQGIVHRDVKPANILLENGVSRVRLTDFGLARPADEAGLTHPDAVAGTPEYMAPEQATGGPVDHRADLFALGGVLYAACTGRPPFRAANLVGVLNQVATAEPPPVRALNPAVPPQLEPVVRRLLAKDPAGRYPSAAAAADALRALLVELQGPPSATPRRTTSVGLWVVAGAVAAAAALAAWVLGTRPGSGPAGPGPAELPMTGPRAESPARFLTEVRRFDGHTQPVRGLAVRKGGRQFASSSGWPTGDGTIRVWDLDAGTEVHHIQVSDGPPLQVDALAASPDGEWLAAGLSDGTVRVYGWAADRERLRIPAHRAGVTSVAVSPDGRAIASASLNGTVRVSDAASGRSVWAAPAHERWCRAVAYAPDGATVASGGVDGAVRFWDARSGERRGEFRAAPDRPGGVWALAYVNGGRDVAAGGDGVTLHDVATGRPRGPLGGPTDGITALAASADGTRLAATSYDGSVCVWDVASGRLLGRSDAGVGVAWVAAFTPDGRVLSGGGGVYRGGKCEPGDRFTIRLWAVRGPD